MGARAIAHPLLPAPGSASLHLRPAMAAETRMHQRSTRNIARLDRTHAMAERYGFSADVERVKGIEPSS